MWGHTRDARLCPGTFSKVRAMDSRDAGARRVEGSSTPARSAAARVVLGWIEGTNVVGGTALALKPWVLDLTSTRAPFDSPEPDPP